MILKIIMLSIMVLGRVYHGITGWISNRHDREPLPAEVQGIYEPERYQAYLNQKRDYRRLSLIRTPISIALECFFLFTPFYQWMEQLGNSGIYAVILVTVIVCFIIDTVIDLPFSYYETFVIEEKYGMNKSTKKEFFKDELVESLTSLFMFVAVTLFFGFVCQLVGSYVATHDIEFLPAVLIVAVIGVAIIALVVLISSISLLSLRLKYKFTDMPDGELRDKIVALTEGSKKKVRRITVYNESSKSISKNAFLLKFMWHREFGIADNFLDGNSERELLAVLAHEAGHLKYKKKFIDYLSYIPTAMIYAIIVWAVCNAGLFLDFAEYVRISFGLQCTNYYLMLGIVLSVVRPVMFAINVFSKYRSRKQEYAADANSVAHGYGQELKDTFMKLSSDELVNVNPSPVIEFLEYSHPGMYNRIRAINDKMSRSE